MHANRALGAVAAATAATLLSGCVPAPDEAARQTGLLVRRMIAPLGMLRPQLREPDAALAMPVGGARVAQVADTWGAPRPGRRQHQGQDIFARRGTPVYSATDGYVVRIGENPLGGQTVWVLGAGGRTYYYAHLDAYAPQLAVGDQVTPDTVLGRVGTTGNARGTPPHLHFGVYTARGEIDPLPLLRDRT